MAARILYPIFLDLNKQPVVLIGAGTIGLRKAMGLLEAGARLKVVSPRFDAGFDSLDCERIVREYAPGDLRGATLAFAATDSRDVNRRIGEDARALGIPVNVADASSECAFVVPSRVRHDGLQIAISTGGEDPARAKAFRRELEQWIASL